MSFLDPDEKSPDHPRNRTIAFIAVLAFGAGTLAWQYGGQMFGWGRGSGTARLERELKIGAETLNRSVPQRVDDVTTLTGARAQGTEFTYLYSLNQEIPPERMQATQADIERVIKPRLCADPNLRNVVDRGATISAEYSDPSGDRIRITIRSCAGFGRPAPTR
jgi:hypothetical protein